MKKFIIITTINPITNGINKFKAFKDWHLVIVGDKKSHAIESDENLTFLSIKDQQSLGYKLVDVCPYNHYTRKNIGYLYAIQHGADVIYDTDDDNLPYDTWNFQDFNCNRIYKSDEKFINIYKYFTKQNIWPRGYPLDEINASVNRGVEEKSPIEIAAWQGLADVDPDVDAIYRLTINKEVRFDDCPSVALNRNSYCPFNSQNTFWNKKAFAYLYLPATTSFRFTDILRGFIAQRLFWEQNLHLGFTRATVYQERNVHDLMKDFRDEVECYLNAKEIVSTIDSLNLSSDPLTNLEKVYESLATNRYIRHEELVIARSWIADYKIVTQSTKEKC